MVVEILNNKSTYNTLELTSGRMAKVARGDVVVGALGHRKALFGYSGHIPAALKPGDVIQMLNIGGVLGICDSATQDKGKPFDCRVLGAVLTFPYLGERIGVPAKVGYKALDYEAPLDVRGVPVVALAGTCMEAGKTAAASAIIARMRHRGLMVDAFKATGVSLRRDILAFEDSGARRTMIFTDLGIVTTTAKCGPALTRTMLTEMAAGQPDVIVFELGDGLLGTYGVESILRQPDIKAALTAVVLSANDPVAAWGGVKLLRERFGIEAGRGHRPRDRQSGGGRDHPRADERRGLQCHQPSGGSWRSHHRPAGPEPGARIQSGGGMSAATPAIVLGGTGYVAGELLRLIAGHPQLDVAAVLSDSQPGAPVAGAFAHLRSAYPELKFTGLEEIETLIRSSAALGAVFRGAARRRRRPHRPAARRRRSGGYPGSLRGYLRRLSLFERRRLRGGVQACAWRAGEDSRVHLRRPRALAEVADSACGASRLLRDRDPARHRALAGAWADRDAPVRDGHHRQHRFRPQAGRGHASSASAQRPIHLWRIEPSACS